MTSTLTGLVKGETIAVAEVFGAAEPRIRIALETGRTTDPDATTIDTDTSVLLVADDGRVADNDALIFYNQPVALDGAVRLMASPAMSSVNGDELEVDLAAIPSSISRLVVAVSIDPDADSGTTFSEIGGVVMTVTGDGADGGSLAAQITDVDSMRAVIVAEIYRRGSEWKIRAVGQGYASGLAALVTDFGIDVDDADNADSAVPSESAVPLESAVSPGSAARSESAGVEGVGAPDVPSAAAATTADEVAGSLVTGGAAQSGAGARKVALTRRKAPARLASDWQKRTTPVLPAREEGDTWQRARLFPSVGIKSTAEQEGRATAVLLAVAEVVPEFERKIFAPLGAPRGKVETFTEVRFNHSGQDLRPDGLVRVTRGATSWTALLEVKTAKGQLREDQLENYVKLARAKGFDAVLTVSCDLMPNPLETPVAIDARELKSLSLNHRSWNEIVTDAAMLAAGNEITDSTRARVLDEFLRYATDPQSGMWSFSDMGKQWVKVRNAVSDGTLGANEGATAEICTRFDQLNRHVALQLSALTGTPVNSVAPANRADSVSRAKQLADSGELFGTLRVTGATGLVVTNANLARGRISCSQRVSAPKAGRVVTKVNGIVRQLEDAPDKTRITAHHLGSRTETTSALLEQVRNDPDLLVPDGGKDIREFTVTLELPMGSKRGISENGFVNAVVGLVNTFYESVTQVLRAPRE